ncbi:MAG: polysaccharide deacetylase family protein [Elusimicrobiota bacterium]
MTPLKHRAYRAISKIHSLFSGKPQGLRTLLYHSVGTVLDHDPYGTSISAELFEAHLRSLCALKDRFEFTPFAAPADPRPRLALTFDDGYADILRIAPRLAELSIPFTLFAAADFIRSGRAPYLCEAGLKELSRVPGASIGSHGKTHIPLVRLTDKGLAEELRSSREYLSGLIGREVRALSYPHGAVDRRVRDAAEEAGYALGGTSRYGADLPGRNPLLLCRTEVTAWDSVPDLELKVSGAWDWFRFRRPDPAGQS